MAADSPRLFDAGRGESVFFRGRTLYPGEDPAGRAQGKAKRLSLRPNTLYILASPLLWYGIETLVEAAPASTRFLAVEHDPALTPLTRERIPEHFLRSPSCRYLECPADEEGIELLYRLGIQHLRRCEVVSLNAGYRLHRRRYARLQQRLQEEIGQFWKHKVTLVHMMPLWIANLFSNLALHRRGFAAAEQATQPVLVAGAGPSLDGHLPLIRKRREQLFIAAVDTAYAPLRAAGILPDAVLLQEGQIYNQYDFIPYPRVRCRIFADLCSHPGILRRLIPSARGFHLFSTEFTATSLFGRLRSRGLLPPLQVPPLGSVGATAVHAALQLSAGAVITCGLDFAFPEGRTHARGAPSHLLSLIRADRFHPPAGTLLRAVPGVRALPPGTAPEPAGGSTEGLYTTPAADSYVQSFARHFTAAGRLYRLGPGRKDMGLRELSADQLEELLDNSAAGSVEEPRAASRAPGGSPVSGTSPDAETVRTFLDEEHELLQECYRRGHRLLWGEGGEKERRELEDLLRRADYLYLYFPDTGTEPPELEPNMLKRLLVSAGRFLQVLEKARRLAG